VQGIIVGAVAILVGAGLATATAFGVVNSASSGSFEPKQSVLEYGTNQ